MRLRDLIHKELVRVRDIVTGHEAGSLVYDGLLQVYLEHRVGLLLEGLGRLWGLGRHVRLRCGRHEGTLLEGRAWRESMLLLL